MLTAALRRLLWFPVAVLAVALITFALGVYGPGDPVQVQLGPRADPDTVARIRHERGLDRPLWEQFADYAGGAVRGDFGESYRHPGTPVSDLIGDRLWVSFQLGLAALALASLAGIGLGTLAAYRRGGWLDRLILLGTQLGLAVPIFLSGQVLLWLLAGQLRWLPSGGWEGLFDGRALLPVLALCLAPLAVFTRQARASAVEVMRQDFVRVAEAKGLPLRVVLGVHVLRNSLIPVVTLFGLALGGLVEGSFIVESLFGIPGIGSLAVESLFGRDYPVIMALALLVSLGYLLANLVADLLAGLLDPRLRTSREF